MKREKSNVMPAQSLVELCPNEEYARITLVDPESVVEGVNDEGEKEYSYDMYVLLRRCPKSLLHRIAQGVSEDYAAWLELAKKESYEEAAANVRAVRDSLLQQSDCRMSLDRIGLTLPTGTTFTSWLVWLKKIAEYMCGAWAMYRQALRDLPAQPGFPYDVKFPTPPKED